jgi:type VI secretion system protein ImpB
MAGDSMQKKKGRVRPPRVHITYDVEIGGAQVKKEIPFTVGVLADLGGKQKAPPKKLKDRNFVEIDRENFNDVLGKIKPRLAYKVANTMSADGGELSIELNMSSMKDFEPEAVVKQIDPLRQLLEVRDKLKDLESRTEGNDRLAEQLDMILESSSVRDKLKQELSVGGAEAGDAGGGGEAGGGDAPAPEGGGDPAADAPTDEGGS